MASRTIANEAFGADLREQLTSRTTDLMADRSIPIRDKLQKLGEVTGRPSNFNVDATISAIETAARERDVVAALVTCPVIPVMDGVFLGYLDPKNPLELEVNGTYRINVIAGQIARIFNTRDVRDGGRFQISSRYTTREDEPDPVVVGVTSLDITDNEIYTESASFTAHADNVLNQAAGLDHKIAREWVNLPRVETNGDLLDTYDRLNIVKGLGENTFRAMWAAVTHAESL